MQDDPELTAVVRSRQLHIYRNGIKVLVLAGKSAPKVIREDSICELLRIERIKWMEQRFNKALAAIKDGSAESLKAIKEDVAELSKYYGSELWKQDFAADQAGKLPTPISTMIKTRRFLMTRWRHSSARTCTKRPRITRIQRIFFSTTNFRSSESSAKLA